MNLHPWIFVRARLRKTQKARRLAATAQLARLELSPSELSQMTRVLDAILSYMETLSQLSIEDVPATTHAVPMDLPLRADDLGPHLNVEAALADAPRREGAFFEVP